MKNLIRKSTIFIILVSAVMVFAQEPAVNTGSRRSNLRVAQRHIVSAAFSGSTRLSAYDGQPGGRR
jgi:hypothetical protein